MKISYKKWHSILVAHWVKKYGYSVEYCDAIAIGKRGYYPMPIEDVPFREVN